MPKHTWVFATALSVLAVLAFIGFTAWDQNKELRQMREQLRQAQKSIDTNLTQVATLQEQIDLDRAEIQRLEKEKQAAAATQKSLEEQMRAAIESKEVTISNLQGRLTVNILDRILFDSGEAVLKPDGEEVLQKIANVLAQHVTRQIHVVGHTDNVPIRASARSRYASNWELSTARATAAVRFLSEKAGVDPQRLGAVGYGEFRPLADNSTTDGRARNRRIELVVLPDQLPAFVPVTPPPEPVTNATEPLVETNATTGVREP